MNYLERIVAAGLVMSFCLIMSETKAEIPQDSLWDKAVALADINQNWVPGLVATKVEMLNKRGEVKKVAEEMSMRLSLEKDGKIKEEIIKVVEDGEDVTDKRKELDEKDSDDDNEEGAKVKIELGHNPFDPEVQKNVSVKSTSWRETIAGDQCVTFEYELKDENGEGFNGTAWLETENGIPLKIEFEPIELPKSTRRMRTIVHYKFISEGIWYPSQITVEASGGFLFIKKHFRMTTTFSEYWKKEDD